ncbi:MAG: NADP-dependent oxidoreductase, partial [Chloroflexota bacterium]
MTTAIVFSSYGGPDVLEPVDLAEEQPAPGQVRVRVKTAGVQPFDALFRSGAAHQWMPAHFPQRLGNEFAGVIDAIGDGITAFSSGDEVLGWAMLACYAEHVIVAAGQIVAKPAAMRWPEAGVLAASGQTAHTSLRELGVGPGDTVLVHAAAGGVGTFAVQLATAWGATVIGTASEANHDYLRSIGATPVTYGDGLAERVREVAPGGVTAALDAAGTIEALQSSLDLVADRTRVGTVAFNPAADDLGVRRISTERSTARLGELH